jgi:hypothetical protein
LREEAVEEGRHGQRLYRVRVADARALDMCDDGARRYQTMRDAPRTTGPNTLRPRTNGFAYATVTRSFMSPPPNLFVHWGRSLGLVLGAIVATKAAAGSALVVWGCMIQFTVNPLRYGQQARYPQFPRLCYQSNSRPSGPQLSNKASNVAFVTILSFQFYMV